jgi:colicin import membrane protein
MKPSPNIDIFHGVAKNPRIGGTVLLSVILHLMAIYAMFFLPNLASHRTFYSPIYSVRLVNLPSFPSVSDEGSKPAEKAQKSDPPPREKMSAKEKERPISLAPPKKDEPTQKLEEVIERMRRRQEEKKVASAIEKIRDEKESNQLHSAIEKIRDEKDSSQVRSAIEGIRKRVMIGSTGAIETAENKAGGGSSGVMSIKFKMYYNLIWERIRSVWVLPEEALRGQKNLETILAIRIAKDGQIEDIQFEKKSGNTYLDESALRAVKKSNPLPPLPPGFEEEKFDVGIRFTPSDF